MNPTRRAVLASALPALAAGQTSAKPAAQAPVTPTARSATAAPAPDYLAISAAQYQRNAEALAKIAIPIETEPAFRFKP